MDLKELTDMIDRTFTEHVDGLEIAATLHGIKIIPSPNLRNTDTVMMVSESAFAELMKRAKKKPEDTTT